MPHLDIQYTANLEADADMTGPCRTLTATLVGLRNDAGEPVFPLKGAHPVAWRSQFHGCPGKDTPTSCAMFHHPGRHHACHLNLMFHP